jgi:hydrogenase maturation protein HypF
LKSQKRRLHVKIEGIVQGVGFRPFVHQLARRHQLEGWVRNRADGVEAEIAGWFENVGAFLEELPAEAPPLARIVSIQATDRPFEPLGPFQIVPSLGQAGRATLISPDACTCPDCLRELLEPGNRRYRYPFINCTHCGPRYTIIRDIPYDRDKTTMAPFQMCPACLEEYEDPSNRRFHAQPNACWSCGPRVWLEAADGIPIADGDNAVTETVRRLEKGVIAGVKGLGGYHLAVLATCEEAVARLRKRKIREEKPFAVMFRDVADIRRCCEVSDEERQLLTSIQRPIVLLRKREPESPLSLAPSVAPRNHGLGAFLPYTPLHHLLFEGTDLPALVMTSGNQSDEPIVMSNTEARERLRDIADVLLLHDRSIHMRCDDSVTRVLGGRARPLRRARGYVPVPVFLGDELPSVLAVGAELKSTVCLTRGREAFVSQHVGDLENLETLRSFEHTIAHLQRILEISPRCIAHDLHPDYLSTQWALGREGIPRLAVQHHHAHIAAVMTENQVEEPVIGLAMDGTGYGPDGTVWGGEILRVDHEGYRRLGRFRQIPLPGGAQAIREPWRMAVSCLHALEPSDPRSLYPEFFERLPRDKIQVLLRMVERRINSPLTSSCGRVFDAASALAGLGSWARVSYEGQAAIELEQAIVADGDSYAADIGREGDLWILDALPMIRSLVADARKGSAPGILSARFHNGMVDLLARAARKAADETGDHCVALSGGVFQNAYLSSRLEAALGGAGLKVIVHTQLPANDACISLGQAAIAGRWLRGYRAGAV